MDCASQLASRQTAGFRPHRLPAIAGAPHGTHGANSLTAKAMPDFFHDYRGWNPMCVGQTSMEHK